MSKYKVVVSFDDVDDIGHIATLASIVTYDFRNASYDFPVSTNIITAIEAFEDGMFEIAIRHLDGDDVDEIVNKLRQVADRLSSEVALRSSEETA